MVKGYGVPVIRVYIVDMNESMEQTLSCIAQTKLSFKLFQTTFERHFALGNRTWYSNILKEDQVSSFSFLFFFPRKRTQ